MQEISDVSQETLARWFAEADGQTQARLRQKKRGFAQSLCADHLARVLLSECSGVPPERQLFRRSAAGKPEAVGLDWAFNVSHSGGFAACAVHRGTVGIDLEALRPVSRRLMQRVCTAEELAWIRGDSARFLQVWTVKEAYLKYLGSGLRRAPRTVETVASGRLSLPGLCLHTEQTARYALAVVYDPC